MDEQQRQQAFVNELQALQQKYGFQVGAQVQTRQLGHVVQIEPIVAIIAIPGWQGSPVGDAPILTPEEVQGALHGNGNRHSLEEVFKS